MLMLIRDIVHRVFARPIMRKCPECRAVAKLDDFRVRDHMCQCPHCEIRYDEVELLGSRPESLEEVSAALAEAGFRSVYLARAGEVRAFDPQRRGAHVRVTQQSGQYPRADVPAGQWPRWRFVRQVRRIVSQGS